VIVGGSARSVVQRSDSEIDYVHALRLAELDAALAAANVPPTARVLEIGASDGFVARTLAERFAIVEAVDISVPRQTYYPVRRYDGRTLPFDDKAFDLIYSSHVMEHIAALDSFLAELARVLARNGQAVHVIPTATWRWWTQLAHYAALPRLVARRVRGRMAPGELAQDAKLSASGAATSAPAVLARLLHAARHGENGRTVTEFLEYRGPTWRERFARAGFATNASPPTGIFYTGYVLRGGALPIPTRRRMTRAFGSSSRVYVTHPLVNG
jgi:SAM-dependent methyltransferase